MNEKLIIKYFPENEFSKEPFQASEDAAGYDMFASGARTLLPKTCVCIPLDLKMAIPIVSMVNFFHVLVFWSNI